jgi:branched-chain amino acid transport system permease protein
MMALGLTLVYGLLRILHIAHAAIFTLGAYIGILVANQNGSLWLAFPAAMIIAGLVGPLIYRLVYEPILNEPPYVALIASIGVLIAMEDGFRILFGPYGLSFRNNPWFTTVVELGGITLNLVQIWIVFAAVVLITAFAVFSSATRSGVAWRATVSDPHMASSFGIASCLAAVAGVLVGLLNNLVEPSMGNIVSYKGLAIIVLGGLGNVVGTLIASIVLGIVESFGTVYLSKILDRDAIAFLFLIIVLMVRPQGLFAAK